MRYNFDEIIDRRNTNALNTDGFRGYIFHAGPEMTFPYADDEFVRMWVADMEFATPPEVCEAIKARVDRRIFGYTCVFGDEVLQGVFGLVREALRLDVPEGRTHVLARNNPCYVPANRVPSHEKRENAHPHSLIRLLPAHR